MCSSCPDGFPPQSPSLSAASAHPSHVDIPSSLLGDLLSLHYVCDMLMTSKSITQIVLLNCRSLTDTWHYLLALYTYWDISQAPHIQICQISFHHESLVLALLSSRMLCPQLLTQLTPLYPLGLSPNVTCSEAFPWLPPPICPWHHSIITLITTWS